MLLTQLLLNFSGTDEEVVVPAVNGTKVVMEACHKHGVKRCVVTSSTAACLSVDPKDAPTSGVWDSSYWSNPDRPGGLNVYVKSKTLAEKAAWKYVEDLPEDQKFELVTILPCTFWGPTGETTPLGDNDAFASHLLGKKAELAQRAHGICDVRDVALAHVRAITVPEAVG